MSQKCCAPKERHVTPLLSCLVTDELPRRGDRLLDNFMLDLKSFIEFLMNNELCWRATRKE